MNKKFFTEYLEGATSTYFDEDDGWVTKHFPTKYYTVAYFEVFGGWQCRQVFHEGVWYDLDK